MNPWHLLIVGGIAGGLLAFAVLVGKAIASGHGPDLHDGATMRDHNDPWRAPVVDLGSLDHDTTIGGEG